MTAPQSESYKIGPLECPSTLPGVRSWLTRDAEQTRWLGSRIAAGAQPGDIISLLGDLGAGKTTFTKGVGVGLGIPETDITSPSFSLIAEHRNGRIPLYHLDVYRLNSPEELDGLGFEDYLRIADGLIIVEWADLVASALPLDRLIVTFSAGDSPNERRVCAEQNGPNSRRLLEGVR